LRASSSGGEQLAQSSKADEVGEADGDLARAGELAAAALGGAERLALGHFAQVQRQQVRDQRPQHRRQL
jgi:hypothetical protein